METTEIISRLKSGDLSRAIDEKGADGLYDLALEIVDAHIGIDPRIADKLTDEIYYALYDIAEAACGQSFEGNE